MFLSFLSLSSGIVKSEQQVWWYSRFISPRAPVIKCIFAKKKRKKRRNKPKKVHFRFLFFDSRSEILKDGAKNIYVE